MRGRLWALYLLQSAAAAFCCGLSQMGGSLGGTMALVACMAVAVTAASGGLFCSVRLGGLVDGVRGSQLGEVTRPLHAAARSCTAFAAS